MIAAIMQPTYLPWIGYFDLIDCADQFVFLDDAQVLKRSWGVRNRILSQSGEAYLTVPLAGHKHGEGSTFSETQVDLSQQWAKKHLATIQHAYARAPHFAEVFAMLQTVLAQDHQTIGALNMSFIATTADRIGITTPLVRSSEVDGVTGRKDERLLSICQALGADLYLAAPGSAAYIEVTGEAGAFAGSGVELRYQNFEHPTYPQLVSEFASHMSIIDLLMNCGYEAALEIIRSGRGEIVTSAEKRAENS